MTQRGRRDFLKSAGAVTAGALVTGNSLATEKTNLESKASPAADITRQTFAEAEKLTGVPYTDSERDVMVDTIEQQVLLAKQLRNLKIKNEYYRRQPFSTPACLKQSCPLRSGKGRRMKNYPLYPGMKKTSPLRLSRNCLNGYVQKSSPANL